MVFWLVYEKKKSTDKLIKIFQNRNEASEFYKTRFLPDGNNRCLVVNHNTERDGINIPALRQQ